MLFPLDSCCKAEVLPRASGWMASAGQVIYAHATKALLWNSQHCVLYKVPSAVPPKGEGFGYSSTLLMPFQSLM